MITEMQPELGLRTAKGPGVDGAAIGLLVNILQGAGWLEAKRIAADGRWQGMFPGLSTGAAERKIRAIASLSGGQILSYPGSPGYKLTAEATIAEVQTAAAKLRHQANDMSRRAMEIDRVYHCKVRS